MSLLALFATEVGLIDLDDAFQQSVLVLHHAANTLTEEPSRLLPDAKVFRQFDRRDTLAGRRHEIERGEPRPHW
jgi:hypothetical protein